MNGTKENFYSVWGSVLLEYLLDLPANTAAYLHEQKSVPEFIEEKTSTGQPLPLDKQGEAIVQWYDHQASTIAQLPLEDLQRFIPDIYPSIPQGHRAAICRKVAAALVVGGEREKLETFTQYIDLPDRAYREGWTLLGLAVSEDQIFVTKMLLEKGADVNTRNDEGKSLMQVAAEKLRPNLIWLLLLYNAEFDTEDIVGLLDRAYENLIESGNHDRAALDYAYNWSKHLVIHNYTLGYVYFDSAMVENRCYDFVNMEELSIEEFLQQHPKHIFIVINRQDGSFASVCQSRDNLRFIESRQVPTDKFGNSHCVSISTTAGNYCITDNDRLAIIRSNCRYLYLEPLGGGSEFYRVSCSKPPFSTSLWNGISALRNGLFHFMA